MRQSAAAAQNSILTAAENFFCARAKKLRGSIEPAGGEFFSARPALPEINARSEMERERTEPYDEYEKLRERLIDCIPDFKLRLKVNPQNNRLVFSADVDSVFDIAWYVLARMMSEDPAPEDFGKEGKLPFYRAGKRYKFKISEVDEWVRNGKITE